MVALTAPRLGGSRNQARKLLSELPTDLSAAVVRLDCSAVAVSTPSFASEVVEVVLVERRGMRLELVSASSEFAEVAAEAAMISGVIDSLAILSE